VSPFNEGTLYLYYDPVRDRSKVSDFDVNAWRLGLRELYERAVYADALSETALLSLGGGGGANGSFDDALHILASGLDALENADAKGVSRVWIEFLWSWSRLLGERPELDACAACGKAVPREEAMHFDAREGVLVCAECAAESRAEQNVEKSGFLVSPGARAWLRAVERLPPAQRSRVSADRVSLAQARGLAEAVVALAIGRRPATWDAL
jgi:DNA repair protein RecO (recombination protein O)